MKISRRTLLRAAAACGCHSALRGLLGPTLSYAEGPATGGNGDNLILLVLNGGHDGLFMFEPLNPLLRSALQPRRPWLLRSTSQLSTFGDDSFGLDPAFGPNPATSNPTPQNVRDMLAAGEAKILSCIGHIQADGQPIDFRSHPQAMNWLMAGAPYQFGNQWVQRLLESADFGAYQAFRLGSSPGMPYIAGDNHKVSIALPRGLSEYDYDRPGLQAAANVLMRIAELETNLPSSAEKVRLALLGMHETVPVVRLIPSVTLSGSYGGNAASLFADTAKILKRRAQGRSNPSDPFYDSGKAVIQIGIDGFDMHEDVLYRLPAAIESINRNLTALRQDLEATASGVPGQSVWDRTVVVMCSEFGRSLFAPGIGSEHGQGNLSLILGGSLSVGSSAVIGTRPSYDELSAPDPNQALGHFRGVPVHNDYRDVFWEVLEWMGLNPVPVFPGFQPRPLGIFA